MPFIQDTEFQGPLAIPAGHDITQNMSGSPSPWVVVGPDELPFRGPAVPRKDHGSCQWIFLPYREKPSDGS